MAKVVTNPPQAPVDLEEAAAEEIIRYAVDQYHPQLYTACSFQKEESVILDMLLKIEPTARIFALDTSVLFPETYEKSRPSAKHWLRSMPGSPASAVNSHPRARMHLSLASTPRLASGSSTHWPTGQTRTSGTTSLSTTFPTTSFTTATTPRSAAPTARSQV